MHQWNPHQLLKYYIWVEFIISLDIGYSIEYPMPFITHGSYHELDYGRESFNPDVKAPRH